jgi:outer membrane receptor protein involved in Fe transport
MVFLGTALAAQQAGSIRGTVLDQDFDAPLSDVRVEIAGTDVRAISGLQGDYVLSELAPGTYTLVFSKDQYVRQVRPDVVVRAGQLTELDVSMPGDYTDLEEFIVQDSLALGGASEEALLGLRTQLSGVFDAIGSDLMSKAGASDAAGALKLVAGASVEDGKFAVIRGLPDRYVSSQLNGVRLPSADDDKRAVELDQFPAAVIESIQVSKTFQPDQQGDASGGAVDVRLKGIPDESIFQIKAETSTNSQVGRRGDFLSYAGGGVDTFGFAGSEKDPQTPGESWDGAVGVSEEDAPFDYKLSLAAGGKEVLGGGVKIGGFASLFYERDSSHYDNGIDDSYWLESGQTGLTPEKKQKDGPDFKTALFDVTSSSQLVQWGGLGIVGAEWDDNYVALVALYTRTAEDTATLAEDTRGKEYFFPGHDPDDPSSPGHDELDMAPYLRTQTLEYTERTTGSLQLTGRHGLNVGGLDLGPMALREPEVEWTLSASFADLYQPDKRLFGAFWYPSGQYFPLQPDVSASLGGLQRIWKTIEEDSRQYNASLKWPLEQWTGDEGYLKAGMFGDHVKRVFDQDTYSNFGDFSTFDAGWDEHWSDTFPLDDHPISAANVDVDYDGKLNVSAFYGMVDLPLTSTLNAVGGARFESTEIGIVNHPEADAKYYPAGAGGALSFTPGAGDVDFSQDDVLPSLGLVYRPTSDLTLRASWSRTVARQTFKEITPIIQQEFLGGPIFIGNENLGMSSLENYDLRADYVPSPGSLLSMSVFHKDVTDPIEYVQEQVTFSFTRPRNYPEGKLSGIELEARQHIGRFWDAAEGLSLGANATFLDAEVKLPQDEADLLLSKAGIDLPERDMTFAPEHIYNLYATYDFEDAGTELALFYTVKGDTLVAGAGVADNNLIPSVYAKQYGTLNFSLTQKIGDHLSLKLQAKNLTNPEIEQVYREESIPGGDVTKTSYTTGREFSLGLTYVP